MNRFRNKGSLYGIILILISIVALSVIFSLKDSIYAEYEKINAEEGCFQGDTPDPKWKDLSEDEKKAKTRKCMTALNKVTQVNYGPYIFSFTLVFGIFLFVLSMIKNSKTDKLMEKIKDDN
jgi:hypothetical protein